MAFKIFNEPEKTMKNSPLYRTLQTPTGRYLSEREFQVMAEIAKGTAPAAIANDLGLSVKTVSTYRARILEKTGFASNAEIAVWAYREGVLKVAA
jgi:DNA-binding NarL/FixJ family response regulator